MKVLIVRLSSMGDMVHSLPALTDAARAIHGIRFDWVADRAFAEIPAWHFAVDRVIASPERKLSGTRWTEFRDFHTAMRKTTYDRIIDIQGHWKTGVIAALANGTACGYDRHSANEWGANLFYRNKFQVPRGQHSIERMRQLVALALDYSWSSSPPDFGIDRSKLPRINLDLRSPYMVFIHSTSWESKCWQEKNWRALTEKATGEGFQVVFPWGNSGERERAHRIAAAGNNALVLPDLSISEKASVISGAHATVGLDTGLSHIAAALDVPSITLYGATDPLLCGATGKNQIHLVSGFKCVRCHQPECTYPGTDKPCCFTELSPDRVWNTLQTVMAARC